MLHRYKITPRSPVITPLASDTLFGHLCWAIRYREGGEALEKFLQEYGQGPAPVIFSSCFAADTLPRPALPPPSRAQTAGFVESAFGDTPRALFKGLSAIKKWNKAGRISLEDWQNLKDGYDPLKLYSLLLSRRDSEGEAKASAPVQDSTMHNTINRESGTVQEGGLFVRDKTWYARDSVLDLYVRTRDPEAAAVADWFLTEYLPASGFGADKSAGMGVLDIEKDRDFDPTALEAQNSNVRMSLSFCAFHGMEQYPALYRLTTRFGKLGGDFAYSSPTGGPPRPFKKPILMFAPGAVFGCDSRLDDVGLLKNVHSDERIRHCGVPLTIPFSIKEENFHEWFAV